MVVARPCDCNDLLRNCRRNPPRRGLSPAHETLVGRSSSAIGPCGAARLHGGLLSFFRESQGLDWSLHAIRIVEQPGSQSRATATYGPSQT